MRNDTASSPLFKIRPSSPRLKTLGECTPFICALKADLNLIPLKYKSFVTEVLAVRKKLRMLISLEEGEIAHKIVEEVWHAIQFKPIVKRTPLEIEFLEVVFDLQTKEVKHMEAVQLLCELYMAYANFILLPYGNEKTLLAFINTDAKYKSSFTSLEAVFHKHLMTQDLKNEYYLAMAGGSINKDVLAKFFLTQPLLMQDLENEMSHLAFLGDEFNNYQRKIRRSIFSTEISESTVIMNEKKCRA